MPELETWWSIAQKIGSGAAFVLGVGCWKIWAAYREELTYSKTRDRETLAVLSAIVESSKATERATAAGDEKVLTALTNHNRELLHAVNGRQTSVLNAIADLKLTIQSHGK